MHFYFLANALIVLQSRVGQDSWPTIVGQGAFAIAIVAIVLSDRRRARYVRQRGFRVCPCCKHDLSLRTTETGPELRCVQCPFHCAEPEIYELWGATSAGIPLKSKRIKTTITLVFGVLLCAVPPVIGLYSHVAASGALIGCFALAGLGYLARLIYWRVLYNRARSQRFLLCPVCEYKLPAPNDEHAFTCSECGFRAQYAALPRLWTADPELWLDAPPPSGAT